MVAFAKLVVSTSKPVEMVDITGEVRKVVRRSKIKSGTCTVFIPHTTAGVTINENADPAVVSDMVMEINKIVPLDDGYRHAEGNSAAHIKSTLYSPSLTLIVDGGDLVLGTWQGIYFCEFDGPRSRKAFVKITDG
jgi:secondary thiamine-phosphate synthase enzyme